MSLMFTCLQVMNASDIYRIIYFGGLESSARREIWPFLLHHYSFTSTYSERRALDEQMRRSYEETMSDWYSHVTSPTRIHLLLFAPPMRGGEFLVSGENFC